MAGRFTDTTLKKTVNSLLDASLHHLDNPFYIFTNKKPTVCTFYNVNDTKSTLDEGSKQLFDVVGPDAPLRYNKINGVFLYDIERITAELEVGDYGLEANDIEGQAILPPNSFQPYVESYFTIDHLKTKYWFRVTKVTPDTLENGSNFWKMDYVMDAVEDGFIPRVVHEFQFIADNVGSNYKAVIEDTSYKLAERLEAIGDTLREYYHQIFFKESLQTYVYFYQDAYFYDPEVIEFMIRNKVMQGGNKYVYIEQACSLPDSFPIDYDRSIYRQTELCNKDLVFRRYYGLMNDDPMSLLSTRLEEYYVVTANLNLQLIAEPIERFSEECISAIVEGIEFKDKLSYLNILANYFHTKDRIDDYLLDTLQYIEYSDNSELYHVIPMIIFIINKEIEDIMVLKESSKKQM